MIGTDVLRHLDVVMDAKAERSRSVARMVCRRAGTVLSAIPSCGW
jgi:hypothetical protein